MRSTEVTQAGPVLDELLTLQAGVVSRSQVLAAGHDDPFVERRLRRRDWARVHRGVYVDHTGPLTWEQRCWAALLLHAPACLTRESALAAYGLRTGSTDRDVHVAIDTDRRVTSVPGVRVHRVARRAEVTHPSRVPSCVRVEHALLAVASAAASDSAAVAVLGDACQLRRTTPQRLVAALAALPRLPRRRLLTEVLDDVAAGAYSALERRYLLRVERPHGLPTAARQRRVRSGRSSAYRDVEYLGTGLVVELDGRLGHERTADRWADLDRDVATALLGGFTLRLGWQQTLQPCRTAEAVARLLGARGWTGRPIRCGPDCCVRVHGDLSA